MLQNYANGSFFLSIFYLAVQLLLKSNIKLIQKETTCSIFELSQSTTDDVTSPDLKWIGQPPSHSTGNLTLSWETDETVTSVCTVESPILVENVSCSNKWIGTHLANGEYILTVRAVDKSGNEAHIIHHWNNSEHQICIIFFL